jgi:protein subunit release factor A
MKEKQLLFSVGRKDCDWAYFCTGGNGGQHRNAKKNGVRCTHRASGAVAEHRDGRDQFRNKIEAFVKMCNTPTFKAWHKMEVARLLGKPKEKTIDEIVDEAMQLINLKIEYSGD